MCLVTCCNQPCGVNQILCVVRVSLQSSGQNRRSGDLLQHLGLSVHTGTHLTWDKTEELVQLVGTSRVRSRAETSWSFPESSQRITCACCFSVTGKSNTKGTELELQWHKSVLFGLQAASLSDKQLQWADGLILVYSICDRGSFNMVRRQLQQIRRSRKGVPVVIVGNKRDLQRHRGVSSEEGRLLALTERCRFFEVSAAETYHGVLLVFHGLVDLVRETRALRKTNAGVRGIVRSVSAVFGKKRAE